MSLTAEEYERLKEIHRELQSLSQSMARLRMYDKPLHVNSIHKRREILEEEYKNIISHNWQKIQEDLVETNNALTFLHAHQPTHSHLTDQMKIWRWSVSTQQEKKQVLTEAVASKATPTVFLGGCSW